MVLDRFDVSRFPGHCMSSKKPPLNLSDSITFGVVNGVLRRLSEKLIDHAADESNNAKSPDSTPIEHCSTVNFLLNLYTTPYCIQLLRFLK